MLTIGSEHAGAGSIYQKTGLRSCHDSSDKHRHSDTETPTLVQTGSRISLNRYIQLTETWILMTFMNGHLRKLIKRDELSIQRPLRN